MLIPIALLDASCQEGLADLTAMTASGDSIDDTNAIVANLEKRYLAEPCQCYTSIGSILIAVNPWDRAGFLYCGPLLASYLDLDKPFLNEKLPPHVYRVAFDMYNALLKRERNSCSVVISGESGAGKTETAKQLTSFIFELNYEPLTQALQDRITQSSRILEAFGNAKTVRNDNSSRFGKLLQLQFDHVDRSTSGAQIQTLLLEKSRIVKHVAEEQNYHVFYSLCLFSSDEEKEMFHIGDIGSYRYLNASAKRLQASPAALEDLKKKLPWGEESVCAAMANIGFAHEDRIVICKILSAVLLLGNVELVDRGENQAPQVVQSCHLRNCCDLVGIDESEWCKWMSHWSCYASLAPRSYADSVVCRDALSKALYAKLFDWIVDKINSSINTGRRDDAVANILDIFGFENFTENSFEQLCINYANEKLHNLFLSAVCVAEQEEYQREGVCDKKIEFESNNEVLKVLEDTRNGLFRALEDVCRKKAKTVAQEEKLDSEFFDSLQPLACTCLILPKIKKQNAFTVIHFCEAVTYYCGNFVAKNKDELPVELLHLMSTSSEPAIANMFPSANESEEKAARRPSISGGSTSKTLSSLFKMQLTQLKEILGDEPFFIRCIKPREPMHDTTLGFDCEKVAEQLHCSGVTSVVRIREKGWNVRILYSDFVHRYIKLLPTTQRPPEDADRQSVINLILSKIPASVPQNCLWQLGKTKIFFRSKAIVVALDDARATQRQMAQKVITRAAQRVAAMRRQRAKDMMEKQRRQKEKWMAAKIQRSWRAHATRERERKIILLKIKIKASVRIIVRALVRAKTERLRREEEERILQEKLLQEKILQERLLQEKLLEEKLLEEKLLEEKLLEEKLLEEKLLQEAEIERKKQEESERLQREENERKQKAEESNVNTAESSMNRLSIMKQLNATLMKGPPRGPAPKIAAANTSTITPNAPSSSSSLSSSSPQLSHMTTARAKPAHRRRPTTTNLGHQSSIDDEKLSVTDATPPTPMSNMPPPLTIDCLPTPQSSLSASLSLTPSTNSMQSQAPTIITPAVDHHQVSVNDLVRDNQQQHNNNNNKEQSVGNVPVPLIPPDMTQHLVLLWNTSISALSQRRVHDAHEGATKIKALSSLLSACAYHLESRDADYRETLANALQLDPSLSTVVKSMSESAKPPEPQRSNSKMSLQPPNHPAPPLPGTTFEIQLLREASISNGPWMDATVAITSDKISFVGRQLPPLEIHHALSDVARCCIDEARSIVIVDVRLKDDDKSDDDVWASPIQRYRFKSVAAKMDGIKKMAAVIGEAALRAGASPSTEVPLNSSGTSSKDFSLVKGNVQIRFLEVSGNQGKDAVVEGTIANEQKTCIVQSGKGAVPSEEMVWSGAWLLSEPIHLSLHRKTVFGKIHIGDLKFLVEDIVCFKMHAGDWQSLTNRPKGSDGVQVRIVTEFTSND